MLDRRDILKSAAAMWLVTASAGVVTARSWRERRDLFPEGVASGDPASDSVVLWTRYPQKKGTRVALTVEVALDEGFAQVVAQEKIEATAALDWTVRVLVEKLKPDTVYWYRFTDAAGSGSRLGRTVTAPSDDDPRAVSFAFVSCQDANQSALNAYRRMLYEDQRAKREDQLGFVLHLGDFIYEVLWYPEEKKTNFDRTIREVARYATNEKVGSFHVPVTLDDYRTVWRGYLADPDLQDMRAWVPFVCIWDNHEYSWRGWQSFEVFGDKTTFVPSRKIAANQAWMEFQPARLGGAAVKGLNAFTAPKVTDAPADDASIATQIESADNRAATESLKAWRSLRYGRNVDLIITDLFSHKDQGRTSRKEFKPFDELSFYPERVMEIIDAGRAYPGGAPETIVFGEATAPNTVKELAPYTMLGAEQKAWLLDQLKNAKATWKIWGCSNGTLDERVDPQNLPPGIAGDWPKDGGYASFGSVDFSSVLSERAEIYNFVRDNGIANFAVVSGDRHSFWAGLAAPALPPKPFKPVGVAFIGGSISSPGLIESWEHTYSKTDPSRALFLSDRLGEAKPEPTVNFLFRHGVKAALEYTKTRDLKKAVALSNRELAPHLSFVDMGGHGYSVVRASASDLTVEFVCIPRPITRSETPDGGPLRYRVRHSTKTWSPGETPSLTQAFLEGEAPLSSA